MSHGDRLEELPPGFEIIGHSGNSPAAAMRHLKGASTACSFIPKLSIRPRAAHSGKFHFHHLRVQACLDHEIIHPAVHREHPGKRRR